MAGNTKILVFKLKELIYTGIFILLGILLIILFICMFNDNDKKKSHKKEPAASSGEVSAQVSKDDSNNDSTDRSTGKYKDGTYASSLVLNNGTVDIEVVVENGNISSVSVKNMDADVEAMYPLIRTAVNDLSAQLVDSQSFENITYAADCKYTYLIIIDAIKAVLQET